ncbi:MAG: T9SS type A sorting domain-containing protein [Chryseolinea sp.]
MIDYTSSRSAGIFFILFVSVLTLKAQDEVHRTENWITDGGLSRVEHSNGYTMLSGFFSSVGPYTGGGALTGPSTGKIIDPVMPKVHGEISLTVADGSGGWFIAGYFDAVDTVKIQNLAHIKSDKTVDRTWKPNPNNPPSVMNVSGTTLYLGGYFLEMAGTTRSYLASFDINTGTLKPWNPIPNNGVTSIAVAGANIYVGGYFTTIGGISRNRLAAVDATSGSLSSWAPVIDGDVFCMTADASSIFIGGTFSVINASTRIGAARLNLTTGAALPWVGNLSAGGYAYNLVVSGNTLYMSGLFTSVNGVARYRIASLTISTPTVTAWNPNMPASSFINHMTLGGTTLYLCGTFDTFLGASRNSLAAVDATTGNLLPWNPEPNASVNSISANATGIYIGGNFNGMNWLPRTNFALLDDATDQAWPFNFDLNGGVVNTIAVHNNILYIGGQFTAIDKTPRSNLAAFNLTTGALLPWNPSVFGLGTTDPDVSVFSMMIKDNLLYLGGKFYAVNNANTIRPGLAAVDLTTGVVTGWNPAVGDGKTTDQYVNSVDISGNTLYAAGRFNLLSGSQTRENIAAINVTNASILPWNPTSKGTVDKIRVTSSTAYVVGEFRSGVGGAMRLNRIAALELTSNNATPWNPDFRNGSVADITLGGPDIYTAGSFDSVGIQFKPGLASFSLATGNLNSWTPDTHDNSDGGYYIGPITSSGSKLYVAGDFNYIGMEARGNYGEYNICPAQPDINASADGLTLSTTSTGALQWFANGSAVDNATGQTFDVNPFEYGVYAVEVTANGCTVRSQDEVYLFTSPEMAVDKAIKVYPNPVKSDVFVELPATEGIVEFTVMDITGRTVKSIQGNGTKHNLHLVDLDAGPYLLIIQTKKQKHVTKIIKTR